MSQSPKFPPSLNGMALKFMQVFHPYAINRMAELFEKKLRFVHYTSSAVGLDLLTNRQLWMRQTSCMTDYMEINHGLECVDAALAGEHGFQLRDFIERLHPGLWREILHDYESSKSQLRSDTFITCLSEHAGERFEGGDDYGRLSMWRAYGRTTGVAFVINQDIFWNAAIDLGVFTTPVAYFTDVEFAEQAGILATTLIAHEQFLKTLSREQIRLSVVNSFATAAVATKHPGFKEEREWRIVRMPTFPVECPLERPTKVINGVPQEVLLLDLTAPGMTFSSIIDRIIIGPTELGIAQHRAFTKALEAAGVENAGDRVRISGIPLRDTPH